MNGRAKIEQRNTLRHTPRNSPRCWTRQDSTASSVS